MVTLQQNRTRPEDLYLLGASLGLADRLLEAASEVPFSAPQESLGDINLPPTVGGAQDQSQLRTASPLYLCSELELARLLPATEILAGLFAQGGLPADPGSAVPLLEAFWRDRHQRWSTQERQALFARIFGATEGPAPAAGDGRNTEFASCMAEFAQALATVGSDPYAAAIPQTQETVRTAAEALAENLLPRTAGIALFAAQELIRTVREALALFEHSSVQHALGQATVWGAVREVCRRYLSEEPDVPSHLTLGKSGALMLAWLAESLVHFESLGGNLVSPADSVVAAAAAWISANSSLPESVGNSSVLGG